MDERRYHTVREIMETFAPRRVRSHAETNRAAVDKLVQDFRERLGVAAEPPSSERGDQRTGHPPASKP